jgi:hypothetical protein
MTLVVERPPRCLIGLATGFQAHTVPAADRGQRIQAALRDKIVAGTVLLRVIEFGVPVDADHHRNSRWPRLHR